MSFENLGLDPNLLKAIQEIGFTSPTPIQQEIIPHILAGKDVIACAQTGSGKTAAFLLPTLHKLLQEKGRNTRALIIAPTRELALQSTDSLYSLSKYVRLRGTAIFGGMPMRPQIQAVRRGVDIISATPGRLLDHIEQGTIDLSSIEILVLDEADRMMDMGFMPDIQKILTLIPQKRQNLIFSATMPNEIMKLAKSISSDPIIVQVGTKSSTPTTLRQTVYPVVQSQKTELFLRLLNDLEEMSSIIVFTRTKMGADRLADSLEDEGIRTSVIHGDLSQRQRTVSLNRFKEGKSRILVATDVAARGIDVKSVSHVINYDAPGCPEDYIHRIGRTARAQSTGDAFSLISPEEEGMLRSIEREIKLEIPRVKIEGFEYIEPVKRPSRGGSRRPSRFGERRYGNGGDRNASPRNNAPRSDAPRGDFAPRGPRTDAPRGDFAPRGTRSDAPRGPRAPRGDAPRGDAPRGDSYGKKPFGGQKRFGNKPNSFRARPSAPRA